MLVALVCVSNLPQPAASAESVEDASVRLVIEGVGTPQISAEAYAIVDIESGDILLSSHADEKRPIASVTKLLLAAQALTELDLDRIITVTQADVDTYGRAGKLRVGEEYTVRQLLFPLLLESSNDAATALERNVEAVRYGGLRFADGSGLSDENQASAIELAAVVRDIYLAEPHVFDITSVEQYIGPYTGWVNNSPVKDMDGYKGGKHGYTDAAGRTLAAVFSEAAVEGREFGYIVLGSDDLVRDVEELRSFVADSVSFR